VRSKTVLPLPAGAETSVTPPAPSAESTSKSDLRATTDAVLVPTRLFPLTNLPSESLSGV
jgi:hypothetical protein